MASVNRCFFIGNLTREPELRYLPNGDAVANFSIAVNETWKDKQGAKQEKAEFINIVAYRKLAEIIGEYCKKGQSVFIAGKFQTRKWEKEGVTRYATEIIADEMQMLGAKDASTSSAPQKDARSNDQKDAGNFDDIPDDIPF